MKEKPLFKFKPVFLAIVFAVFVGASLWIASHTQEREKFLFWETSTATPQEQTEVLRAVWIMAGMFGIWLIIARQMRVYWTVIFIMAGFAAGAIRDYCGGPARLRYLYNEMTNRDQVLVGMELILVVLTAVLLTNFVHWLRLTGWCSFTAWLQAKFHPVKTDSPPDLPRLHSDPKKESGTPKVAVTMT